MVYWSRCTRLVPYFQNLRHSIFSGKKRLPTSIHPITWHDSIMWPHRNPTLCVSLHSFIQSSGILLTPSGDVFYSWTHFIDYYSSTAWRFVSAFCLIQLHRRQLPLQLTLSISIWNYCNIFRSLIKSLVHLKLSQETTHSVMSSSMPIRYDRRTWKTIVHRSACSKLT